MIVARYIIPLAILMPYHYNTVFSCAEVIIWLVGSPVFIFLQRK